jgi:hypothetical protein
METHIGHCGIDCYTCPAYTATQAGDWSQLEAIARRWSTPDHPLTAREVECYACHSERPSLDCGTCAVKKCAEAKHLGTCAECPERECGRLRAFYATLSGVDAKKEVARANLDALTRRRG